jgi:hypothetical protein
LNKQESNTSKKPGAIGAEELRDNPEQRENKMPSLGVLTNEEAIFPKDSARQGLERESESLLEETADVKIIHKLASGDVQDVVTPSSSSAEGSHSPMMSLKPSTSPVGNVAFDHLDSPRAGSFETELDVGQELQQALHKSSAEETQFEQENHASLPYLLKTGTVKPAHEPTRVADPHLPLILLRLMMAKLPAPGTD